MKKIAITALFCTILAINICHAVVYDLNTDDSITDVSSATFMYTIGLDEMAEPAAPAADKGYLWIKADGSIHYKNDAGTDYDLTTGGAVGVSSIRKAGDALLTGNVTLTGGANITLTQAGQDVSIASVGGGVTDHAALTSTGTLTHLELENELSSLATTYLTLSSATATYLQNSSATATYLSITDAASTYLPTATAQAGYMQNPSTAILNMSGFDITGGGLIAGDDVTAVYGVAAATGVFSNSVSAASFTVTGVYTLPTVDGTVNYIMKTDGAGALTWQADNDTTDHTSFSNIGTNTHAEIDTRLNNLDTSTGTFLTTAVESIAKAGDAALTGAVTLTGGSNVTLTQVGQDISIASTGGSSASSSMATAVGGVIITSPTVAIDFNGTFFTGLADSSTAQINISTTSLSVYLLDVSSAIAAYLQKATPFAGDVTGLYSATVVGDDSHAHTGATLSGIDISDDTNLTAGDALTITLDEIDFDGGASPAGDLGGTWAAPTVDDDSHTHTSATLSTAAVTNGAATMATGDQIFDFCETTQRYVQETDVKYSGVVISTPTALPSAVGIRVTPYLGYAVTYTTITAIVSDGTSVTFNLDQRPYSLTANAYDTEGIYVFSSALVADSDGYAGAATGDLTVPANYALFISTTARAVSGDVGAVDFHMTYTRD